MDVKSDRTCPNCKTSQVVVSAEMTSAEGGDGPRRYRSIALRCTICGTNWRTTWKDGIEVTTKRHGDSFMSFSAVRGDAPLVRHGEQVVWSTMPWAGA